MDKHVLETENSKIPIVTILGHVDHGKTTILDKIRDAHVQEKEVGGITQKISALTIDIKGKKITFVDTPGHQAFDLMRVRGGSIADIVLLIVAADDSVKPQTEESIEIIKKSTAKPIVVINKIDLPNVNLEKVLRDISSKGLEIEGMGGKIPVVKVSGKTGEGLDDLLEMISLLYEMDGPKERAELQEGIVGRASVLESIKEKSRGNVSTVVLIDGVLKKGDWLGYQADGKIVIEKVKGMISEEDAPIEVLRAGYGGKILGLSNLIELGSDIFVLQKNEEKLLKDQFKKVEEVEKEVVVEQELTEDGEVKVDLSFLIAANAPVIEDEGDKKLNVIVKSSSQGSLEAILKSLDELEVEGYTVKIIHSGVGDISVTDVQKAEVTKSIILGFEVGSEKGAIDLAQKKKILVRVYDIIYKLIDEVSGAIDSLAAPVETEEEIGNAKVKAIFTLSDGSQVIGCRLEKGVVKKGCKVYIVRGDDIVAEGRVSSMRHGKDIINEAKNGQEFGVILEKSVDAVEGDALYCYKIIK